MVGYPQVELLEVGKEGFSFKATVAVYPEVTLGQYKGVEAPRAEVNVTGEDVDARLKEMAENYYDLEWTWVVENFRRWWGKECCELTAADIAEIARRWCDSVVTLDRKLYDAPARNFHP